MGRKVDLSNAVEMGLMNLVTYCWQDLKIFEGKEELTWVKHHSDVEANDLSLIIEKVITS
jgi:hypothetical protein